MQRNQIALAVAALAVCCLGALTITSQRTELLVGSYHVGPAIPGKPTHHAQGFGNQAASIGDNPNFYNSMRRAHHLKAHYGQKNLVGSYNVGRRSNEQHKPQGEIGIGNQAASMGNNPNFYNAMSHAHGSKVHMQKKGLVGSYPAKRKGMPVPYTPKAPLHNGGVGDQIHNSARKVQKHYMGKKSLVGSFHVDTRRSHGKVVHQPHGIGNQAASNGYNPNFYNHAGRKSPTSKLLVGSTFVNPKDPNHPVHQPHGMGNQAAQMGDNPAFYNAPSRKAKAQKLLVGSFNVDSRHKGFREAGIGNQAAPQNHFDVGTNIVFNGVKSEGGIKGIRKHHAGKKGLVGSTFVQRKNNHPLHQPHGYGDQSASHSGAGANFYNAPSH